MIIQHEPSSNLVRSYYGDEYARENIQRIDTGDVVLIISPTSMVNDSKMLVRVMSKIGLVWIFYWPVVDNKDYKRIV